MESMIERVARAILDDLKDRSGVLDGIDDDVIAEIGRDTARAAIEAMRSAPEHLAADLRLDGQHIASYHDIIDAALNEQVTG